MIKTPTIEEKVRMYEDFLHAINMNIVCMNNLAIHKLIENADRWSYAHRRGNGMMSEEEQQECIDAAFWRLCDDSVELYKKKTDNSEHEISIDRRDCKHQATPPS